MASLQNGGFLKIHQIDSNQDSGIYTCIVRNRGGEEARREIELAVNSKRFIFINWCSVGFHQSCALFKNRKFIVCNNN